MPRLACTAKRHEIVSRISTTRCGEQRSCQSGPPGQLKLTPVGEVLLVGLRIYEFCKEISSFWKGGGFVTESLAEIQIDARFRITSGVR